jgi:uncharacterized protein (TIGR02246 family)
MNNHANTAVPELISTLETGWASGNGASFSSVFSDDAVFVNVEGSTLRGRAAIAEHHQTIFATIYRDSTISTSDLVVQSIRPDVATFSVSAVVLLGDVRFPTHAAGVVAFDSDGWRIRLFHNMVPFLSRPGSTG